MANLLNDRNELLFSSSSRVTGASVSVTPGAATSVIFPKNSTTPVPTAVTLTANLIGYVVPSFAWSYRFGNTGAFTAITETTNPVTVAWNTAFYNAAAASTLVQYKVAVQETTSNLGINQAEFILSVPIIREGSDGAPGINNVVVRLFQRTANNAAPAVVTTGNSTYTFSTGQVVGQPSGWTQAIPSTSDSFPYIWMIETTAATPNLSYQFANTLWTAPILFTQNGIPGVPGTSTATVFAYKRSTSLPTDNPGTVDYSFSTNTITTASLANNWSKTIPSGTDTIYITAATAASTSASDTINSAEWSTPVKFVENATNSAIVFLYARNNNSSTAPTLSTGGSVTYNFTTGTLSGTIPAGWTQSLPDVANGSVLWAVQAIAVNTTTTDTIENTEWNAAKVLSVNGINGTDGTNGTNGATGTRGTRQLYFNNASYTSTYQFLSNAAGAVSYAAAATALIASTVAGSIPTTPIKGDTVTFSNGTDFVYTITYNSDNTAWEPPGTVIDGSLLVTGSVTAAKINSNGLSIKSLDGLTTILSAGVPLDFSNVGGATKPANNANNTSVDSNGAIQGVSSGAGTIIDNTQVKVGGTNFLLNSSRFTTLENWGSNGGTLTLDNVTTYGGYNTLKISGNAGGIYSATVMRLKADTVYTVSALVKGSSNALTGGYDTNLYIESWTDEDQDDVNQDTSISHDTAITTSWRVIQQTFRTGTSATATYCSFLFYPLAANFTLNVAYVKLEEGNKATDWTPNPEEIKNKNISVSISNSGVLTASGGPTASGSVSLGGLGGLSKSSADTLSAVLSTNATTVAGLRAGDLVWNSSGVRTSGKGVALTQSGIVGHNGTKATFNISATTGDASFGGALDAASGTFAGALSAATGTFSGALSAATGTFSGSLTASAINAIDTINIAGNAVTVPAGTTGTDIVVMPQGTEEITVLTTAINNNGAPVIIACDITVYPGSSAISNGTDSVDIYIRLKRNGTTIRALTSSSRTIIFFDASPGLGTSTYTITVQNSATTYYVEPGNEGLSGYGPRSIFVMGAKR